MMRSPWRRSRHCAMRPATRKTERNYAHDFWRPRRGFAHRPRRLGHAADATGTIKTLDAAKSMVTLDNGATYDIAKGVSLSGFKLGEKVKVTYTQSGKMMDASAITPAA
jgi:hypothetical protein